MTAGNRLLLYTTLPTPVFLPGKSQGQGSLVGCRLRGRTESNTTEVTAAAAADVLDDIDE